MLWIDPTIKHASWEDPSARLQRLQSIASDIAEVCKDQNEVPVFDGEHGRIKTCLMMASIAFNESGYKKSVDFGEQKGDSGRSVCVMQVQAGQKGPINYTHEQLKDRKTCLRAGLRVLRYSKCNNGSDPSAMLRGYVSGRCEVNEDPEKEKSIASTARNDARAYVKFMENYKNLLEKVVTDNGNGAVSDNHSLSGGSKI
jgi:hypothetical protein